jgi:hypothetical protein
MPDFFGYLRICSPDTFMAKESDDQYSPEVTKERMIAALRGARLAGHKPMESLTRSKAKKQSKPKEKI